MENKSILIREKVQADDDELRKLYLEIRQNEFDWVDSSALALEDFDHNTEGEYVLVATVNHKIAGFISVWEPDKFIHNLFVSAKFRRLGLGKALIAEAAKAFGAPLTLKCVKENKHSLSFYLSNGWKIEKEETCLEGPYFFMSYTKI